MIDPNQNLSNALGIDFEEAVPVNTPQYGQQSNALVTVVASDRNQDSEIDYQKSREIYSKVAEIGMESMGDLAIVAKATNEPRAYEVLATLIKSLNETAKQMNDLHAPMVQAQARENNTVIEKAVFVGSQADLLKAIKNGDKPNTTESE